LLIVDRTVMNKQKGFTLIEIMISLVLGLIVIGGAISIYISTIRSSTDITNSARLNYDLDSVMQLMVNDIRRAGYWGGAIVNSDAKLNPFINGTANIQISDYTDADGDAHLNGCIVYSYDANGSGANTLNDLTDDIDENEYFGFRLDRGAVWMRSTVDIDGSSGIVEDPTNCDDDSDWGRIIDENKINIESLSFTTNHKCLNIKADTTCAVTALIAGDQAVEVRQIDITLIGNVVNDDPVEKTLRATVKVRNNRIFTQP